MPSLAPLGRPSKEKKEHRYPQEDTACTRETALRLYTRCYLSALRVTEILFCEAAMTNAMTLYEYPPDTRVSAAATLNPVVTPSMCWEKYAPGNQPFLLVCA